MPSPVSMMDQIAIWYVESVSRQKICIMSGGVERSLTEEIGVAIVMKKGKSNDDSNTRTGTGLGHQD